MINEDYLSKTPYDIYIEFKNKCKELYEERKNYVYCLRSYPNDYDSIDEQSVNILLYRFTKNLEQLDKLKNDWENYVYEKKKKYDIFERELKYEHLKREMHPSKILKFLVDNDLSFEEISLTDLYGEYIDNIKNPYNDDSSEEINILEEEDFEYDYYENMTDEEFQNFMNQKY